jgi:hypothetical protein
MMIGVRYVDSMDHSRTLVPVSQDGTCRVFFDGIFVGKAKAPVKLFNDSPSENLSLGYYGYNVYREPEHAADDEGDLYEGWDEDSEYAD